MDFAPREIQWTKLRTWLLDFALEAIKRNLEPDNYPREQEYTGPTIFGWPSSVGGGEGGYCIVTPAGTIWVKTRFRPPEGPCNNLKEAQIASPRALKADLLRQLIELDVTSL